MNEEQKFHRRVMQEFTGDLMRVESSTVAGIPDLNWCVRGREMWIELKVYEGSRLLVRKLQYAWGLRRAKHGGAVWLVAYDRKKEIYDLWKFPQVAVQNYNDRWLQVVNTPQWTCVSVSAVHNFLLAQL